MRHMCRGSAVIERFGGFLNTRMQPTQPDLEETSGTRVVSHVFVVSKRQPGIEIMLQSDSIRGAMETEGGIVW